MLGVVNVYQLPIILWCYICQQEHPRTLNLPDNVTLDGKPHFSCARCNGGDRYHAPQGLDASTWIEKIAALDWQCASCHRPLNLENVREYDSLPVCARCRTRAQSRGLVIGHPTRAVGIEVAC